MACSLAFNHLSLLSMILESCLSFISNRSLRDSLSSKSSWSVGIPPYFLRPKRYSSVTTRFNSAFFLAKYLMFLRSVAIASLTDNSAMFPPTENGHVYIFSNRPLSIPVKSYNIYYNNACPLMAE